MTFLAGTAAFHATSYASQLMQLKLLGVSTGTRPAVLPISLGMMTVAFGSWAGHLAGLGATRALSAGWMGGGGVRRRSWYHDDDDGAPSPRPSELGCMALRSMREMTRPMFLGITGGKDAIGGLSTRERRERREAWMHAARM